MALDLRIGETLADAILAFRAYLQMHAEGLVPGSLDQVKMLTNVIRITRGPGSCLLMAMDGDKLAGVLSLYEQTYWYSEDRHLIDKGLYVLPEYRDGTAFELLLNAAQAASDDLGLPCYLFVFNPKRKRGGRSKWERVGATLGYTNRGAILAHIPET